MSVELTEKYEEYFPIVGKLKVSGEGGRKSTFFEIEVDSLAHAQLR